MSVMKPDRDKNEKLNAAPKKEGEGDKAVLKGAVKGEAKASKTGKTGSGWTVIDSLIVLMVLVALAGVIVRGVIDHNRETDSPVDGPYYVDFVVAEIHPTVLSEIQAFDSLYLYETGELVGYVGMYDDGTIALHQVGLSAANGGGTVSAEGCMVCLEGVYRNGSLLVTGMDRYISPGAVLVLRTDRAVLTVEITAIRADE